MKDTYPDKSLEQEYDDAEREAIEKADRMLDDEKNRIDERDQREIGNEGYQNAGRIAESA
jgi:hypothetical protein